MSRIGKKPIPIPSSVSVTIDGSTVRVKGQKGELTRTFHPHVTVAHASGIATVRVQSETDDSALWGLSQRLLSNMLQGVNEGYTKKLELIGVGYRAAVSGQRGTWVTKSAI